MQNFKVALIGRDSQDIGNYPDNEFWPECCKHVEDDEELFIINLKTRDFYKASEFFYMVNIDEFATK